MDFGLELALQIVGQALEQRLLDEVEKKRWNILYWSRCNTIVVCNWKKKQKFSAEVFPCRKREWFDLKTDSTKYFWVEKLQLLESFEDCRESKKLTVDFWEERGEKSEKLYEKK